MTMITQTAPLVHPLATSRDETSRITEVSLSFVEQEQLVLCERTIATGWQTFLEVGLALSTIREERLYRAQYPSFEIYCRARWQFHRAYAYRLITAAQVVKVLSPIGDIPPPANEAQVRPLIGLTPDQIRETWEKACVAARNGKPTSRLVARLAAAFRPVSPIARKRTKKDKQHRSDSTADGLVRVLECLDALESDIREGQANLADLAYISEAKRHLRLVKRGITKGLSEVPELLT